MDEQDWIKRLPGSEPSDEGSAQPASPTTQPSVPPRTADVTETASGEQSPEQIPLPQISPPAATPSPTADAEAAVAAVWQVGDVILDQYEVKGILGEGGMGTVYKVHHRGWNTDLAVKSPRPEIFAKAGGKENFVREAETWVNLGLHPHIVGCYYVRTLGGIPRVFAEYVEGGSLSDWIRTRRLYEGGQEQALERLLDIAIQFAWGLHGAHEHGLIHQDVKPANVMMTVDGAVKVTDFGLAKARAMAGEAGILGEGQSILVSSRGMTPAYCSPEQTAGLDLSRKTDIWSWGVSVLELFVGGVTWLAGLAAAEALASHETLDPAIPVMPAEVVKLLARCFQPRPEDRPATMLEVATELQTIYTRLVEYPYPREIPKPAEVLADSLNNRALSLYDLGKVEEAKRVWEQALQTDQLHPEAIYNLGIVRWQRGELTDEAVVHQLEAVRAEGRGWQATYLLALVQLERGETEVGLPLLREAAQQAPKELNVQFLLDRVQRSGITPGPCMRTFQGHLSLVDHVCLGAERHWALNGAAGIDKGDSLTLYEVATRRQVRTYHTRGECSVNLSADERWAISGSEDHAVQTWDVATGRCMHIFRGHTDAVTSVSLSADGRFALSGSADKTIRLWGVATERCLRIFQVYTDVVTAVSLSTDGRWVLSGSGAHANHIAQDYPLRLWEVASGRCVQIFRGHTSPVHSVSLSADGSFALSGSGYSWDKNVRLWEVASGRCLRTFRQLGDSWFVSLSADGRFALARGWLEDKILHQWEMPCERFCALHISQIWSHSNVSHVQTQMEALLKQAERAIGEAQFTTALGLLQEARALPGCERMPQVLEAWTRLSSFCRRVGPRAVWPARSFVGHRFHVQSASLSADGSLAISGSAARNWWDKSDTDNTLRLWEVASGRCVHAFQEYTEEVYSVSLSADGSLALSLSGDGTVRLWEVASGRCLRTFTDTTELPLVSMSPEDRLRLSGAGAMSNAKTSRVSLSADGRFAISGSLDNRVWLWEVASGRCLRTFRGHTERVMSVCLSADGRFAISGDSEGTMRVWEVSTARCLGAFAVHTRSLLSLSPSADGRWVLSGSADTTLGLWEVASGRCVQIFRGHTSPVHSVSLSADGSFALSGSGYAGTGEDLTVRLWEVATGRCLRTLQEHTGLISSVSLSADGRFALSGSWDKTLRLWELDWELEACDPTDWDEGALPYLETFLALHTPYAGTLPQGSKLSEKEIQEALTRRGKPTWNEQDFQELIRHLQYAGYGWLRPEGVRAELERLTSRQFLEIFLVSHSGKSWLGGWKKPQWTEQDFQQLLTELRSCGYNSLQPEGVRAELKGMASDWQRTH